MRGRYFQGSSTFLYHSRSSGFTVSKLTPIGPPSQTPSRAVLSSLPHLALSRLLLLVNILETPTDPEATLISLPAGEQRPSLSTEAAAKSSGLLRPLFSFNSPPREMVNPTCISRKGPRGEFGKDLYLVEEGGTEGEEGIEGGERRRRRTLPSPPAVLPTFLPSLSALFFLTRDGWSIDGRFIISGTRIPE